MSKHSGDTLPGVEVKDADVFVGAAGGHVLTRRIELNLPGQKKENPGQTHRLFTAGEEKRLVECAGRRYPEQTAVLTQGSFVEFLLFAAADVENPEGVRRGKKEKKSSKRLSATTHRPFRNAHTFPRAHLMQRSWQPTAAYLQVGSTPMSYRVVLLTMWWERRNSVPLSVCETNEKVYLAFIYLFKRITLIWIQLVPTKASRSYLQYTS